MTLFNFKDHKRQLCQIKIWEQPWKDFLEVQHQECAPENIDTNENGEQEEKEPLPLLGKNMINRRGDEGLKDT